MQFSSRSIKFVIAGLVMACASVVSHAAATVRFSFDSKTGRPVQDAADSSTLCPGLSQLCRGYVTTDVPGLTLDSKRYPAMDVKPTPQEGLYAGWRTTTEQIELRSASNDLLQLSFKVGRVSIAYGFSNTTTGIDPLPSNMVVVQHTPWLMNCVSPEVTTVASGRFLSNVRMTYGAGPTPPADHYCAVGHNYYDDWYGGPHEGGAWGVALGLGEIRADLSKVPSGVYSGTHLVGVDFGLGMQIEPLNFEVTVQHDIIVERLSPTATLQPRNGWGGWSSARPPPNVYATLPFILEAGSGIKAYLGCITGEIDGHCALEKQGVGIPSSRVPVQAFLSTTYFTEDPSGGGRGLIKMPLKTNGADAVRIVPRTAWGAWNRAELDLLVDQAGVNEMMRYPGSHYQGTISVIFEWAPPP